MNLALYRDLFERFRPPGRCSLSVHEQGLRRARWVYTFRDAAGEATYVGCTSDPYERFMAHSRTAPWWDEVASVDLMRTPDRASGLATELTTIKRLRPKHNVMGIPEREAAARAKALATRRARFEKRAAS